jgi:hypothetical protein|tara:strand:- start:610 stop:942 length:333 start_codon:yes stop_codon:yes gene_type:complete
MNRYQDIEKLKNKNVYAGGKGSIGTEYYKCNFYPEIPQDESDIWVITEFTDRLDLLANQFYGDMTLWWIIAIANPDVLNMGELTCGVGKQIRIPQNINEILSSYNELNEL